MYREPFAGGAALFFALRPARAVLTDANEHLIRCYAHVRTRPTLISRYLAQHARRTSESYYYAVRDKYNQSRFSAAQAARFIYLNKTCFNGIFRVNTHGTFNVPYGRKEPPALPTPSELQALARALRAATLRTARYTSILPTIGRDSFVYLDPPYPPLNGTAYFQHYTIDRFSMQEQERLAALVASLHKRGALFMMTNADLPLIRRLYKGFRFHPMRVTRYVSCKSQRHVVQELIITNYEPSLRLLQ